MSEEKKCIKNEICEDKKELTQEELEQVSGGGMGPKVAGVIGSAAAAGVLLADGQGPSRSR